MAIIAEKILLGILDEEIHEKTSCYVNKIGGIPDALEDSPVHYGNVCRHCQKPQILVSQIYCPLDGIDQHRVLYLFGCTTTTCWNQSSSWSAIRYQARDESYATTTSNDTVSSSEQMTVKTSNKYNVDAWGFSAGDWSSEDTEFSAIHHLGGKGTSCLEGNTTIWNEKHISVTEAEGSPAKQLNISSEQAYNELESGVRFKEISNQLDDESDTEVHRKMPTDHEHSVKNYSSEKSVFIRSVAMQSPPCMETPEHDLISSDTIHNTNLKNTSNLSYLKISQEKSNDKPKLHFKPYYIDVFDEPLSVEGNFKHEHALIRDYAGNRDTFEIFENSTSSCKETYEKTSLKHDDRTFHQFLKRISRCPEQILRYQYNGEPLPIRKLPKDDVIPACQICGSSRIFELQLMPTLVDFLRYPESNDTAIEFGTVLVYTCKESCQPSAAQTGVTEYVVVQADPDQHLFKT